MNEGKHYDQMTARIDQRGRTAAFGKLHDRPVVADLRRFMIMPSCYRNAQHQFNHGLRTFLSNTASTQ